MRKSSAALTAALSASAGLAVGYQVFLRQAALTWGATPEEAAAELPGDELLPGAHLVTTRATGIAARPADIWPWLVQLGPGRGGAYTYDWIENLLGLEMHSADTVLPEFQNLKVGDVLPLGASGPCLRVAVLEPEQALVLASEDGYWVWAFALRPDADGTRLLSRNRIALPPGRPLNRLCYRWVMEPGSLVMERRMLQGIKERAESLRAQTGDRQTLAV